MSCRCSATPARTNSGYLIRAGLHKSRRRHHVAFGTYGSGSVKLPWVQKSAQRQHRRTGNYRDALYARSATGVSAAL